MPTETGFGVVTPSATAVAVEVAQEVFLDSGNEALDDNTARTTA
jgi:hypothetical protein